MKETNLNIPVLALRGMTVFPDQTTGFDVERDISMRALNSAMENDREIFAVTQREISVAQPQEKDLYTVGTLCQILQIIKTSDTSVRVLVQGCSRGRINRLWQTRPFLQANIDLLETLSPTVSANRVEALLRQTYALFGEYQNMVPDLSDELVSTVLDAHDPGRLADYIGQNVTLRHQQRQRILEELHPVKRLQLVNEILTHELDVISLEVQMEKKVRAAIEDALQIQNRETKIEEEMAARVNVLKDISASMARELGREATLAELAERMKMSEDEIRDIMKLTMDAMKVSGQAAEMAQKEIDEQE